MIEVFEKWMNYINPSVTSERSSNSFKRLRYPNSYKEIIHITKYERDSFKKKTSFIPTNNTKSSQLHYEFINVWPTNMSSMKVNYGQKECRYQSFRIHSWISGCTMDFWIHDGFLEFWVHDGFFDFWIHLGFLYSRWILVLGP